MIGKSVAMFGVVPKRKLELGASEHKFRDVSVKSSLKTVIRSERDRRQLIPLIKQDSENVSKAMFLYQRDLEKQVHTNIANQLFFDAFHRNRYHRDSFTKFCRENKGRPNFPNLKNCSELLATQANQYEVCFYENIKRNLRNWISTHYQFFSDPEMSESDARKHVNKLFSGEVVDTMWEVTVAEEVLNLKQLNTKDMIFNLIPKLLNLNGRIWHRQMECESAEPKSTPYGLRTFNVVAQKQWGAQYIHYNARAMIGLLNKRAKLINRHNKELKVDKKSMPFFSANAPARRVFKSAFSIEKFKRQDEKGYKCRFALRVSTDGVGASLGYSRRIDEKPVSKNT